LWGKGEKVFIFPFLLKGGKKKWYWRRIIVFNEGEEKRVPNLICNILCRGGPSEGRKKQNPLTPPPIKGEEKRALRVRCSGRRKKKARSFRDGLVLQGKKEKYSRKHVFIKS